MELSDRMKKYEEAARSSFPPRMPLIIRVDGKAFSKLTAKLPGKPFNRDFISIMEGVAMALCHNIQGAELAYSQSDEVSVLVHSYKTFDTQPWFDNQLQKVVSVAAAIASATFTSLSWRLLEHNADVGVQDIQPAYFDARAFVIPEGEVTNYFMWRQQDAVRNSVQMLARSLFSHKQCEGKSVTEMKAMCQAQGQPWEDLTPTIRKGRCVKKHYVQGVRSGWHVDTDIPMFGEKRSYIENLMALVES